MPCFRASASPDLSLVLQVLVRQSGPTSLDGCSCGFQRPSHPENRVTDGRGPCSLSPSLASLSTHRGNCPEPNGQGLPVGSDGRQAHKWALPAQTGKFFSASTCCGFAMGQKWRSGSRCFQRPPVIPKNHNIGSPLEYGGIGKEYFHTGQLGRAVDDTELRECSAVAYVLACGGTVNLDFISGRRSLLPTPWRRASSSRVVGSWLRFLGLEPIAQARGKGVPAACSSLRAFCDAVPSHFPPELPAPPLCLPVPPATIMPGIRQ